jgi:hypothetical protein
MGIGARTSFWMTSKEFKNQMLERVEGRLGEHPSGGLRCETAEAKAERIITEELSRLGWSRICFTRVALSAGGRPKNKLSVQFDCKVGTDETQRPRS